MFLRQKSLGKNIKRAGLEKIKNNNDFKEKALQRREYSSIYDKLDLPGHTNVVRETLLGKHLWLTGN